MIGRNVFSHLIFWREFGITKLTFQSLFSLMNRTNMNLHFSCLFKLIIFMFSTFLSWTEAIWFYRFLFSLKLLFCLFNLNAMHWIQVYCNMMKLREFSMTNLAFKRLFLLMNCSSMLYQWTFKPKLAIASVTQKLVLP